jgi:S1-C subfamily serine protease
MPLKTPRFRASIVALALAAGFAAPPCLADEKRATEFIVQVEDRSQADKAWIGVWLQDVIDGGIQVIAVVPGGPAELASLRVGDIILAGNSHPLTEQLALNRLLSDLHPGEPLELRVVRGDKLLDAKLTVASRASRYGVTVRPTEPYPAATPPSPPRAPRPVREPRSVLFSHRRGRGIGVHVTDVTPALRTHYGAPSEYGVLVTRSDAGGIASQSGIVVGDLIVRIGGIQISTSRDLDGALLRWDSNSMLTADLVRDRKPKTVELDAKLESHAEEAQDRAAAVAAERELMGRRMRVELQRLERRMDELRKELEKLERDD